MTPSLNFTGFVGNLARQVVTPSLQTGIGKRAADINANGIGAQPLDFCFFALAR
jgi:hypothetical protein